MSSAPWSYAIQRYWGDPQMAYSGYKCDPKTTFWQRWVSWRPFVYGPQEFTESKTMKGGYFFASLEGNQAEEGKHLVFVGVQHQVVRDSSRICCEYGMGLCNHHHIHLQNPCHLIKLKQSSLNNISIFLLPQPLETLILLPVSVYILHVSGIILFHIA